MLTNILRFYGMKIRSQKIGVQYKFVVTQQKRSFSMMCRVALLGKKNREER